MKIGFCGAGGTGKSTTAKMLAEYLALPLVQSPSRACFAKRGVLTEDDQLNMSPGDRYFLQLDIFQAIDEQVNTIKEGVFERTHLDNFFYLLHRCHDVATEREIREMEAKVIAGLHTFDLIVFFPLYQWDAPPEDGMRTIKFGGRYLADAFIRDFLNTWEIYHLMMGNAHPQVRLHEINLAIQEVRHAQS